MIMLHHLDPARILGVPQSSSTRVAAESESCSTVEGHGNSARSENRVRAQSVSGSSEYQASPTGLEFPRNEEEYETFMAELAAMEQRWR